jgi:hypothetical protein
MGVDSDTEIAVDLEVSRERVRQIRSLWGIPKPPYKKKPKPPKPTPWWADLCGSMSDVDLSVLSGVSQTDIFSYRHEHGIARYRVSKFDIIKDEQWRDLTFEAIAEVVGNTCGAAACSFYTRNRSHIERKRRHGMKEEEGEIQVEEAKEKKIKPIKIKIRNRKSTPRPWWVDEIGTMFDHDLAALVGVKVSYISYMREREGITARFDRRKLKNITDEQWKTLTFNEIAEISGAGAGYVCKYYHEHKSALKRVDGRSRRKKS